MSEDGSFLLWNGEVFDGLQVFVFDRLDLL